MEIFPMKETKIENVNEDVPVLWQPNRKPEYDELNKILIESPAVGRWMRKMRGKPINKFYVFRAWLWWCKTNEPELYGLNPDGLIDYQKKTRGTDAEFVIHDAIDGWLYENGGVYNTLRTYKTTINSFFMHNRAELTKDPTSRLKPTRFSQVAMFTLEEIRSIYSTASPMIRAVMLSLIMGGMGCEELLYWSQTGYNSLVSQLENNEPLIKVELPGRKKMKGIKPYYTILGRDAIKALKEYLKEREKLVDNRNSKHIFISTRGNPLTYSSLYQSWMRLLRRLKLIRVAQNGTHHRYGKNLHELRDFYRTRWEKSPATKTVGEYFMGHTIDRLGYNKAFLDQQYMKQEYSKAEPFLNVISQDPTKISQYELIRKQNEHREQIDTLTSALEMAMQTITMLQNQLNI
jgi:integrase